MDIDVADLLAGLGACLRTRDWPRAALDAEAAFGAELREQCMATLCVRTAFDLALQAMDLKAGDEVLMSAFNIPHMAELVRLHGAVPIPADLDPETMTPLWAQMEASVTPRTRAIVVAHLFGARVDLGPGIKLAQGHGLCFVEDAAQAFAHDAWRGHPQADVSLFSFGAIKTATALGGGVALVRDPALLERMRRLQADYPTRSNPGFARKIFKYLVLRGLAIPLVYGSAARLSAALALDFDGVINDLTRSFRGADLLQALRWRPAAAQLGLIQRRLKRPSGSRVISQARAGARVAGQLPDELRLLGGEGEHHAHWLFPVLCSKPEQLIAHLRRAGFDATRGGTTLSPIAEGDLRAPAVEDLFDRVVYLPVDGHLRPRELENMIAQLDSFSSLETGVKAPSAFLPAWAAREKGAIS